MIANIKSNSDKNEEILICLKLSAFTANGADLRAFSADAGASFTVIAALPWPRNWAQARLHVRETRP
jgi:hypothetical protein